MSKFVLGSINYSFVAKSIKLGKTEGHGPEFKYNNYDLSPQKNDPETFQIISTNKQLTSQCNLSCFRVSILVNWPLGLGTVNTKTATFSYSIIYSLYSRLLLFWRIHI